MKPKDSPRGYLDISEVSLPPLPSPHPIFPLHLGVRKTKTARYSVRGRWMARAEVLLLPQVGLGENLGGKGGPGAAADGNLVEVDFFDQF